jgi:hypothetical protein
MGYLGRLVHVGTGGAQGTDILGCLCNESFSSDFSISSVRSKIIRAFFIPARVLPKEWGSSLNVSENT